MELGKRRWNCTPSAVADALWPPPVSLERKRTLSGGGDGDDGGVEVDDGKTTALGEGEVVTLGADGNDSVTSVVFFLPSLQGRFEASMVFELFRLNIFSIHSFAVNFPRKLKSKCKMTAILSYLR